MPFKSRKQQRWMEAHKAELEHQGVNLKEWEQSTDYKHLPEKVVPKKKDAKKGKKY